MRPPSLAGAGPRKVRAVVFDLDDTLYPQTQFLSGAWSAVAAAAPEEVDREGLERQLARVAAGGSGRGGIIDGAVDALGLSARVAVGPLVQAFWSYRPGRLDPYPGVAETLDALRPRVLLGLVTDGEVGGQRAKLAATGLAGRFDAVVLSDELGREFRKPHPAPFAAVAAALGVEPAETVFVGDRPDKDVAGARAAGMWTVRVRTGEYAGMADDPEPWASAPAAGDVAELLTPLLGPSFRS